MHRRARIAEVLCIVGGGALLASAFAYWIRRGPGHSLRGHELVDTVAAIGHDFPGLSGARLTVLWYLLPALGACAWIAVGVRGARSNWTRAVAIAAVIATGLAIAAFARLAGHEDLGFGAYLAGIGALALLAGAWFPQ